MLYMKYAKDKGRRMEFDNKRAFFDYIWSDLESGGSKYEFSFCTYFYRGLIIFTICLLKKKP